jgi:hypothetical protein
MSWPRVIDQRPWFAWRPVRAEAHDGSKHWRWLVTVRCLRWATRHGDHYFEWNRYALLP